MKIYKFKSTVIALSFLMCVFLISCDNKKENKSPSKKLPTYGAIKSVPLKEVDQQLASQGQNLFEMKCSACHKINERYIGPAIKDVTIRRTPEWIMNMILDPIGMAQNDPTAKKLLAEYGAPMANQSLTQKEARAILEYFRITDIKK